jgi:hypothetical protein
MNASHLTTSNTMEPCVHGHMSPYATRYRCGACGQPVCVEHEQEHRTVCRKRPAQAESDAIPVEGTVN